MNAHAKAMRDRYGVSYQRALNLIRKHGLEQALEIVQADAERPVTEKPVEKGDCR